MLLALLLSCANPYPGACDAYTKLYCDTCELEDYEKPLCTCVKTGKLTADDMTKGYAGTDDDAQLYCDQLSAGFSYPAPDEEAYCKQQLVLMQKHDKDVCDFAGVY